MSDTNTSTRQRTSFMWEVVPVNLFLIYAQEAAPDTGLHADLLVEVSGDGKLAGSFRWALRDSKTVKAQFSMKGVSSYADLDQYELTYEVKPCDLPFRQNTSTTSWEDLADLVKEGRIAVSKNGEDASQELLGKIVIPVISVLISVNLLVTLRIFLIQLTIRERKTTFIVS
jgi:hypothetical protein